MAFGSLYEEQQDAPMSDINVTPLVDVMLVLLIVFMITMPVLTHSIQMNLPVANETNSQLPEKIKDPINIAIDINGNYLIGAESTEPIDLEAVKIRLQQIAAENKDAVIAISADKDAAYDHVIKLLETTRETGLSKVGFMMEVESLPQQPN